MNLNNSNLIPCVSVITVCFNELPQRINYTLDSIFNQEYKNYEVIVIDGGSEKITLDGLTSYRDRFSYFISERDEGIYDGMNKGLAVARGKWIIFMNIGDRFHSKYTLKQLLEKVHNHNQKATIYYGDYSRNGEVYRKRNRVNKHFLYDRMVCHQSILAPKEAFENNQFLLTYKIIADKKWLIDCLNMGFRLNYTAVIVCDSELGRQCGQYQLKSKEDLLFRKQEYSFFERFYLNIYMVLRKIYFRVRTRNYKLPLH